MQKPKLKIAVTICTRRRPQQLAAALAAATAILPPTETEVFVVVVENDISANVEDLVRKHNGSIAMHYFLEPERGISAARNRAIEEALTLGADWIATFDDDGEIAPDCIANYLLAAQTYTPAALFIGRTRYLYPESMPDWYPKSDSRPIPTGASPKVCSTSNSFFHRSIVAVDGLNLRFDAAFSLSGGEDADFFSRARKLAAPIIWIEEAIVFEKLIESRATLGFFFKKQLRNGQNWSRVSRKKHAIFLAFLMQIHALYRNLVLGTLSILGGAIQLLFNENAGLKLVFAGLMQLTLAAGMISSYFVKPVEWYKKTDGH